VAGVLVPDNVFVVDLEVDVVDVVDVADVVDVVDEGTIGWTGLPDVSSGTASMTVTRKSHVRSPPEQTAPSTQATRSALISAVPGAFAMKLTRVAAQPDTGCTHSTSSRTGGPSGRRIDPSVGPMKIQFDALRVTVMR
jgi:hypothetical protein